MIYRLLILITVALSALLITSPAYALKMGPMMASSTTYAPSAPVSVSGSAGNGQVTVTWSAGTVDGTHSAATSYNLYRSTSSGAETLWQSGVTSPYVDTASNGTSYYYKVQAVNSAGNALSTEAGPYTPTATVYAPNIPVIGTATAGNAQATVAFTASVVDGTHSAATSYTVTSSPGGFTATGSASPLTVTGLTNGTAYTFTVTATNTAGTSAASADSNSVTPSASSTWTDTFAGTSFNSRWTASLGGDAAWTWNSPGVTASSPGHAASAASLLYLNSETLDRSTKQFKITLQLTNATTFSTITPAVMVELEDASKGTPGVSAASAAPYSSGRLIQMSMIGASGSTAVAQLQYNNGTTWLGDSTNSTWGTTNNWSISLNTSYVLQIDTTSTTVKFTLYQADGTTVVTAPPAVNWTSLNGSPTAANLVIGDPFTDFYYPAFKVVKVERTL